MEHLRARVVAVVSGVRVREIGLHTPSADGLCAVGPASYLQQLYQWGIRQNCRQALDQARREGEQDRPRPVDAAAYACMEANGLLLGAQQKATSAVGQLVCMQDLATCFRALRCLLSPCTAKSGGRNAICSCKQPEHAGRC